jgi:hypothetical protein
MGLIFSKPMSPIWFIIFIKIPWTIFKDPGNCDPLTGTRLFKEVNKTMTGKFTLPLKVYGPNDATHRYNPPPRVINYTELKGKLIFSR